MNPQFLADGLVSGSLIGLGAVGLTLTYSILRFANFAHGEFMTFGAYAALLAASVLSAFVSSEGLGDTSLSPALLLAAPVAFALAGLFALALDRVLFSRLRGRGEAISLVMASFGASLAIRAGIEFAFTSRPAYFTRDLAIAGPVAFGLRATPDQILLFVVALALLAALHLLVAHTRAGRAMRAVAENPSLARLAGIDVEATIRLVWAFGGALAAASGVMLGLLVQIRPFMGFDLLLPMFAAAIVGGVGSVSGAFAGGLIVGLSEALTVQIAGAEWRAAVAVVALILVLLIRPTGLAGKPL